MAISGQMNVSIDKHARPPYVDFERREVEDRAASIAAGKYVAKNEDVALITPQGSKDQIERPVKDWFPYLEQQVQQGRMDPQWVAGWKYKYEMWQKGQDIPLDGTPIRTWPVLTPAQVKVVIAANILTVEDLALANDEALQRLGMGANQLKERAKAYLEAANGPGKLIQEVTAMRVESAQLKADLEAARATNQELIARLNALLPPTPAPVVPPAKPAPAAPNLEATEIGL